MSREFAILRKFTGIKIECLISLIGDTCSHKLGIELDHFFDMVSSAGEMIGPKLHDLARDFLTHEAPAPDKKKEPAGIKN